MNGVIELMSLEIPDNKTRMQTGEEIEVLTTNGKMMNGIRSLEEIEED